MTRPVLGMALFAGTAMGCIAVSGDSIRVREFARSMAEFTAADQEQVVSFAPLPGMQRTFTVRQVEALARRTGVQIGADRLQDVCFIQAVQERTKADFLAALVAATQGLASSIEVLDFSRGALPEGRLEFPRTQVVLPPASAPEAPVLWRGRLVSSSGHSYPTWVKARILAETELVFAKETLLKGHIITPDQVELRVVKQFPFVPKEMNSRGSVAGKMVRREIASGREVTASAVEEPKEIATGDTVRVESASGLAQIHFEAQAQTGGRKGETILMQNPANGRSFRALVTGKGRVEAVPAVREPGVSR